MKAAIHVEGNNPLLLKSAVEAILQIIKASDKEAVVLGGLKTLRSLCPSQVNSTISNNTFIVNPTASTKRIRI